MQGIHAKNNCQHERNQEENELFEHAGSWKAKVHLVSVRWGTRYKKWKSTNSSIKHASRRVEQNGQSTSELIKSLTLGSQSARAFCLTRQGGKIRLQSLTLGIRQWLSNSDPSKKWFLLNKAYVSGCQLNRLKRSRKVCGAISSRQCWALIGHRNLSNESHLDIFRSWMYLTQDPFCNTRSSRVFVHWTSVHHSISRASSAFLIWAFNSCIGSFVNGSGSKTFTWIALTSDTRILKWYKRPATTCDRYSVASNLSNFSPNLDSIKGRIDWTFFCNWGVMIRASVWPPANAILCLRSRLIAQTYLKLHRVDRAALSNLALKVSHTVNKTKLLRVLKSVALFLLVETRSEAVSFGSAQVWLPK